MDVWKLWLICARCALFNHQIPSTTLFQSQHLFQVFICVAVSDGMYAVRRISQTPSRMRVPWSSFAGSNLTSEGCELCR